MARLILTLWFAVATLLGPGLCCCLASAHAHLAPTAAAEPAAPRCPNCARKHGKAPAKVPKQDCPCKKDSGRCHTVVKAAPPDTETNPLRLLAAGLAELPSLDLPPRPALFGPRLERSAGPPFLDTDDLLYGCHILRC